MQEHERTLAVVPFALDRYTRTGVDREANVLTATPQLLADSRLHHIESTLPTHSVELAWLNKSRIPLALASHLDQDGVFRGHTWVTGVPTASPFSGIQIMSMALSSRVSLLDKH